MSDELRRKSYVRVGDELYPEDFYRQSWRKSREEPAGTSEQRLQKRAADLYDLVRRALANPASWVEWQREAIAVVDYIENKKGGTR